MRDWGHEEGPPSIALRLEIIALLIAWALGIFLGIATLIGSPLAAEYPANLAAESARTPDARPGEDSVFIATCMTAGASKPRPVACLTNTRQKF